VTPWPRLATAGRSAPCPWDRIEPAGFYGFGLALMVLLDLFPAGVLQLWDSISHGYWHARRLSFLMSGTFHTLEWLRIVADLTFLLAGVLPLFLGVMRLVLAREENRP